MKKSKSTEEQIALALKQAEAGTPVEEVRRNMGILQGGGWPSIARSAVTGV